MTPHRLPPEDEMYQAAIGRVTAYDGIFYVAVKTTGIFCRPSCPARKPARQNVEFFALAKQALTHGYRPCKRCRPLEYPGATPGHIRTVIAELEADPSLRLRDRDIRSRGINPSTLRRWFKAHHGMTFHAFARALRLGAALRGLSAGESVTGVAFDSGFTSMSGFQEAVRRLTGDPPSKSGHRTVIYLSKIATPVGPMLMGSTDVGVCLLEFTDRPMLETQLTRLAKRLDAIYVPGSTIHTDRLGSELTAYFSGAAAQFDTPLVTVGTPFQERVWAVLRTIPYGQTKTYRDQARQIDSINAVRAVARANGDNRISIVIPCHRVIGSDGKLTGYGGGLWRKRWLLHLERAAGNPLGLTAEHNDWQQQ